MAEYVGRTVWKSFSGYEEPFKGTITEYDEAAQFWSVKYEDGDQEDLSEDELQGVLVDPAEAGPTGVGAKPKKRGRKKLLQPQKTRRATAQALAPAEGPSSEAAKGKRALRSPATTTAEKHAEKPKQDGKKQRLDGGKLEKRFSFGEMAARTLTMMSGRSGQAARDTATSNDIVDSRPKAAVPSPSKAKKTKSLQALSGPTVAKGAEMLSAEGGQPAPRLRGRPAKHLLPTSKQQGNAVASQKQGEHTSDDGRGAEEIFIPLEKSAEVEDEAAGIDDKAGPAIEQADNMAADREDWGAGEKAAPPGSLAAAAIQRVQQAEEMKPASPKEPSGGARPRSKALAIRRGAPTSGPLEGPTRFHNHVAYNGVAYIAGQTAKDHSVQEYAAQTKQVLHALDEQLKAAGSSRNNILKANVLLKDIALGAETFNAIWEKWIDPKHAPARMTFEASLIHPELLVEVDAIAAVPADQT